MNSLGKAEEVGRLPAHLLRPVLLADAARDRGEHLQGCRRFGHDRRRLLRPVRERPLPGGVLKRGGSTRLEAPARFQPQPLYRHHETFPDIYITLV